MRYDPATLRAYASIYEKPKRDGQHGKLMPIGEFAEAAAYCLRLVADQIETDAKVRDMLHQAPKTYGAP